jgi:hypothetical protein
LAAVQSQDQILALLNKESMREAVRAQKKLAPTEVEKLYREELNRCTRALESGEADLILHYVPGKELLEQLARKIGCRNGRELLSAATKHIDPGDFPGLARLKQKLS